VSRGHVHQHGLRRHVVVVERLVVRVLQEILIGPHGSHDAQALLNHRAEGNGRLLWGRPAIVQHTVTKQRPGVRHPRARTTSSTVEHRTEKTPCRRRLHITDPQLDALVRVTSREESRRVGREAREAPSIFVRKLDMPLGTVGHLHHGKARGEGRAEVAVGHRIDAPTTNAEHGLRHIRDGRHALPMDQHQPLLVGTHRDGRRGRSVEDLHHFRRWKTVRLLGGGGDCDERDEGRDENEAGAVHSSS